MMLLVVSAAIKTTGPDLAAHVLLAAGKLQAADLEATSKAMQARNAEMRADLQEEWQGHFRRMFEGVQPAAQQPRPLEQDFDTALKSAYGVALEGCECQKGQSLSAQ